MSWAWRKANQGEPAPSPQTAVTSIDTAIAQADALRDARRWSEAAEAYQVVLQRVPQRGPIWVQLGHARKESGDLASAEAAYRQALELSPDVADTHLQLGHVLKLRGARPEAVASYARALLADRGCTPALTELISLGEGWKAEQASGLGQHMLASLLQATDQIRATLAKLEQSLPDVASLTCFPPANYDLLRTQYRLPAPPATPQDGLTWAVLVLDRQGPEAVVELARSLAEQCHALAAVTVVSNQPDIGSVLTRFNNGGLPCPVHVSHMDQPSVVPPCDWLLVISSDMVLLPGALDWLRWAASQCAAAGFYPDEELLINPHRNDAGSSVRPVLKAVHDPECDVNLFRHGIIALRGQVAANLAPEMIGAPDPLQEIIDTIGTGNGFGHLARILARRVNDLPPPQRRRASIDAAPDKRRIGVIIPTRNGAAVLRPCIDAIRSTAAESALLDIVILDNGSDDPETGALLAELQTSAVARVVRDDALFNWSRLNNAGVAACESPLLLFVNDDVSVISSGWDAILRRHLARPEVGAVGIRLDYPDGGLQHGGIVFGPGGRTEHEGVASIGVLPEIAARWVTRRQVGAVTGAFLACRRGDFLAVDQFDAAHFPIWFNDVDFCLRLRAAGMAILYEPAIRADHHESRTLAATPQDAARQAIWDTSLAEMQRRWGEAFRTDPGFNPYFARVGRPFELMTEPSPWAVQQHLLQTSRIDPWHVVPNQTP